MIKKGLAAFIALSVYIWPAISWATPLSYTGEISYQNSDGDDTTDFRQTISLDLSQDLTSLMRLNETIRYSSSYQEGSRRESITPALDFTITNDFFRFSLSGTANRMMDSNRADRTSKAWEVRLGSTWQKYLWPDVQISYGQDFSSDDQSPPSLDNVSDHAGFDVEWDVVLAELFYSIDLSEDEDNIDNSNGQSSNQLARLSTGTSFLNNRIDIDFTQQYSRNDREYTTTVSEEGFAHLPVSLIEARAGWPTDPDGNPDYEEEPEWTDLSTAFPTPIFGERYNIALQLNDREVDTVYMYTSAEPDDLTITSHWDLYLSTDGQTWKLEETSITAVYNRDRQRFELSFSDPVAVRYLMLVENNYPIWESPSIAQIETYRREFGDTGEEIVDKSVRESYLTTTGLDWRILDPLVFNYNFSLEQIVEPDGEDLDKMNNSASLFWEPKPSFNTTVSATESLEAPEEDNETKSRSYSLSLAYKPLRTLDFSLGVTRSESYEAGTRESIGHSYNLYTTAEIYPDLTSSLDIIYSTSDQEEEDETSNDLTARWKITARLIPDLTVDFSERYSVSKDEGAEDNESYNSRVNLSWRPSDLFSLNAGAGKTWQDEGDSPFTYNMTMNLAPSEKTQLNMGYNHSQNSDNYQMNWNWIINDYFSLRANCSYVERRDESRLTYGSRFTVRY